MVKWVIVVHVVRVQIKIYLSLSVCSPHFPKATAPIYNIRGKACGFKRYLDMGACRRHRRVMIFGCRKPVQFNVWFIYTISVTWSFSLLLLFCSSNHPPPPPTLWKKRIGVPVLFYYHVKYENGYECDAGMYLHTNEHINGHATSTVYCDAHGRKMSLRNLSQFRQLKLRVLRAYEISMLNLFGNTNAAVTMNHNFCNKMRHKIWKST